MTATDPAPERLKAREKTCGQVDIIGAEHRMTHLWLLDVASKHVRRLTSGEFTVGSFSWSPDGRRIAFDHRVNSDNANGGTANISIVTVADGAVRALVTQEGPDTNPVWSPDGVRIAFETKMANPSHFYTNSVLATIPAAAARSSPSTAFDEDPRPSRGRAPSLVLGYQKMTQYLFRSNTATKRVTKVALPTAVGQAFSVSATGEPRLHQRRADAVPGRLRRDGATTRKLTNLAAQTAAWAQLSRSDLLKSQDGAMIEACLQARRLSLTPHPLLAVIHGGPTALLPIVASTSIYPTTSGWAAACSRSSRTIAGALAKKFQRITVATSAPATPTLSGTDVGIVQAADANAPALWAEPGGYISAHTTHDSTRFKATPSARASPTG